MAVPRPILLALIGVLLLAATFFASASTRNSAVSESSGDQAATSAPAQPAGLSADQALNSALGGGAAVKSAKFDFDASVEVLGDAAQKGSAGVSGSFQGRGKTEVPLFDVNVKVSAQDQRVNAGAVSLGDRGFVKQGDTAYKLPDAAWKNIIGARSKVAEFAKRGKAPSAAGVLGVDTSGWLTQAKDQGTKKLDGVETRHVTASVDTQRMARALTQLAKQGGAPTQLPPNLEQTVSKVVRRADVEAYVGTADRVPRRLSIALELDFSGIQKPPAGQSARAKAELEFNLTEVNKPQRIAAPAKVSSAPLSSVKGETAVISSTALGVGALAFDPPPGLAQARQAGLRLDGATVGGRAIRSNRTPKAVERAIKANKRVVLFFRQSRGVDDPVIATAVARVKARRSAMVFTDNVDNIGAYGRAVSSVGVTRAPSVVIVGKSGKARLIEGYIDPAALAQEVADTR